MIQGNVEPASLPEKVTPPLKVLDLFSGIGGFSLGLERTGGFRTQAFCEIDPFCRRVLKKHWPEVPCYEDVRELTGTRLAADGIAVDVICGGFPCQDISVAGDGAGLKGKRSGLWREYARLIGELRPRFVFVENVSALLGRGLGDVLGELSAIGYDAEWDCVPAAAVSAPHRRDRLWVVAYPSGQLLRHKSGRRSGAGRSSAAKPRDDGATRPLADANSLRQLQSQRRLRNLRRRIGDCGGWSPEPDVGRVAHGVPNRVDRLRALGNAVVPQIPEMIGRAILEAAA